MNSGYGVKEASKFLLEQAELGKTVVMFSSKLGNPQESIVVYLWNKKQSLLAPVPWWPEYPLILQNKEIPIFAHKYKRRPEYMESISGLKNVFFVYPFIEFTQEDFKKQNPRFKKVLTIPKPDPKYSLDIYNWDLELPTKSLQTELGQK